MFCSFGFYQHFQYIPPAEAGFPVLREFSRSLSQPDKIHQFFRILHNKTFLVSTSCPHRIGFLTLEWVFCSIQLWESTVLRGKSRLTICSSAGLHVTCGLSCWVSAQPLVRGCWPVAQRRDLVPSFLNNFVWDWRSLHLSVHLLIFLACFLKSVLGCRLALCSAECMCVQGGRETPNPSSVLA